MTMQKDNSMSDKARDDYLLRLKQVEDRLKKTKSEITLIHEDVMAIKSMFDQLRGGWKGLITLIGGASLLGALIANVISILKN